MIFRRRGMIRVGAGLLGLPAVVPADSLMPVFRLPTRCVMRAYRDGLVVWTGLAFAQESWDDPALVVMRAQARYGDGPAGIYADRVTSEIRGSRGYSREGEEVEQHNARGLAHHHLIPISTMNQRTAFTLKMDRRQAVL
jgi:hypothetical protein